MKTNVTTYATPEVQVQLSNIVVNPKTRKATFTLGTKEKGKRKFSTEQVEASITSELYNYLTLLRDEKIKIVADNEQGFEYVKTGVKSTSFQRFLAKKGIEFKSGLLKELVFTSDNTSDQYLDNPFRVVLYDNGSAVMTLVNLPSKSSKETVDVNTGEIKTNWSNKIGTMADGKKVKAFIRPQKYRRLVIQYITERKVFQEA